MCVCACVRCALNEQLCGWATRGGVGLSWALSVSLSPAFVSRLGSVLLGALPTLSFFFFLSFFAFIFTLIDRACAPQRRRGGEIQGGKALAVRGGGGVVGWSVVKQGERRRGCFSQPELPPPLRIPSAQRPVTDRMSPPGASTLAAGGAWSAQFGLRAPHSARGMSGRKHSTDEAGGDRSDRIFCSPSPPCEGAAASAPRSGPE